MLKKLPDAESAFGLHPVQRQRRFGVIGDFGTFQFTDLGLGGDILLQERS
jgi:hypothetical protein